MGLKKLIGGVLHVQTADGLRCVELTSRERVTLLWLFRNFKLLPESVLGKAAQQLVHVLLGSDRSQLRCAHNHAEDDDFVIGTIECASAIKATKAAALRPIPVAAVAKPPALGSRVVS